MKLKLLFKGGERYLATEHGDIIENISIIGTDFSMELADPPNDIHPVRKDVVFVKHQMLMQIRFEGQVGVIPTDVEGTVASVPQLEEPQ